MKRCNTKECGRSVKGAFRPSMQETAATPFKLKERFSSALIMEVGRKDDTVMTHDKDGNPTSRNARVESRRR